MGEVYRAHDSRLRRDVAVKVLHHLLDPTPEHVQRLAREARAAGGLNHPNIVAVYDVGTDAHVPYVVSELLQGESLRSRLSRGLLPYRKAVEYATQVAQALGVAHDKGICHRDVKPGNIFITGDGRVKLLDFGLVKIQEPRPARGADDSTADFSQSGVMQGTIGYMSPEQVLGEAVDHRTDLFSLGAVLYEMLTGTAAFVRDTPLESTRAILDEDPVDPLLRNPQLPAACVPIVIRCLEKRPAERFQSARDLAFHLQQLQDVSAAARARPTRTMRLRWVVLAALGVAAVAGAAWLARSWPAPTSSFEQLTFRRARIAGARFASEEGAVIYAEAREGRPLEVWWLSGPGSPESRTLGYREADVLAVRSGKIALSLNRRFVVGERFVGRLAEAPIGEGSPHELLDGVEEADWDPQGEQLAITRSITVGGESRLEYPPGRPLYRTAGSIRFPRFSPDGKRIAFFEDPSARGAGGVVTIVDLQAQARVLSRAWISASGLAWSPRGDEVWFAAGGSRTSRVLRAVDLEGRERVILQAPGSLTLCDVARNGRVLLARDEERSAIVGVPPGSTAERDLSWFDNSGLADLSDDGWMLLFADRFGIYVRRTDGSPPIRLALSDGFADDISPDGRRVLATSATSRQLLVLPVGLGAAEPVSSEGKATYRGSLWLPDGKRILFNRAQPGEPLRSYVQALDGGQPKSITEGDTWVTAVSPDGKWAAAIGAEGISLHPIDGGPHRVIQGSQPEDRPVSWSADGRALWIFRRGQVPAEVSKIDIATGQRQLWKRLSPPDATGVYSITDFRVTPDGRSYAYSYKRVISQLYAAEGLR